MRQQPLTAWALYGESLVRLRTKLYSEISRKDSGL